MPRMSSGSSRADIAVEPTRSQNITVSCRRSAASALGSETGPAERLDPPAGTLRLAIALRSRFRCPSGTPSFSRSASVSSGRTSASISLSRKTASYWPRPTLRSQSPTSMIASTQRERTIANAQGLVKRRACVGERTCRRLFRGPYRESALLPRPPTQRPACSGARAAGRPRFAIACKTEPGEANHQHRPSGRLGDGASDRRERPKANVTGVTLEGRCK